MLHINKIRENKESYIALLKVKNIDATDLKLSNASIKFINIKRLGNINFRFLEGSY